MREASTIMKCPSIKEEPEEEEGTTGDNELSSFAAGDGYGTDKRPVATKVTRKQLEEEAVMRADDLLTAIKRWGVATKDCEFNKADDLYSVPCRSAMKTLGGGGPNLHANDDEGGRDQAEVGRPGIKMSLARLRLREKERARRKEDEELCAYNTAVLEKMKAESDRKKNNENCFAFYKESCKVIGNQRPAPPT